MTIHASGQGGGGVEQVCRNEGEGEEEGGERRYMAGLDQTLRRCLV